MGSPFKLVTDAQPQTTLCSSSSLMIWSVIIIFLVVVFRALLRVVFVTSYGSIILSAGSRVIIIVICPCLIHCPSTFPALFVGFTIKGWKFGRVEKFIDNLHLIRKADVCTVEVTEVSTQFLEVMLGNIAGNNLGHQGVIKAIQFPKTLNELLVDNIVNTVDVAFERLLEEVRLGLGESIRSPLLRVKHEKLCHHATGNVLLVTPDDRVDVNIPATVRGNQFNIHQALCRRLS